MPFIAITPAPPLMSVTLAADYATLPSALRDIFSLPDLFQLPAPPTLTFLIAAGYAATLRYSLSPPPPPLFSPLRHMPPAPLRRRAAITLRHGCRHEAAMIRLPALSPRHMPPLADIYASLSRFADIDDRHTLIAP